MPDKLVSICIPAYENVVLLKRLLDSVTLQNYPAIEVIISDDSAGEDIKNAISGYESHLHIKYFKNNPPLQSPGNWNNALDKATGELLMLIHQDDWLNGEDVIQKYVAGFEKNVDFVFSRSMAFSENDFAGLNSFHKKILHKMTQYPEWLLLGNVIGPPSNVMVKKNIAIRYTPPLIWLVDVDYYIRLLMAKHNFYFIDEPLASIGLHEEQATKYVEQNKEIILREHLMLAASYGEKIFSDWRIYDLYWRLLRNFKIKEMGELALPGIKTESLPASIKQIIKRQSKIPPSLLNTGIVSKMLMWLGYRSK